MRTASTRRRCALTVFGPTVSLPTVDSPMPTVGPPLVPDEVAC
jgi:hypothetical protein